MLAFVSFSKNNTYFLKHEVKRKNAYEVFFKVSLDFPFLLQVACLVANYLKEFFFFRTSLERKVIFFFMGLSFPQKTSFKTNLLISAK